MLNSGISFHGYRRYYAFLVKQVPRILLPVAPRGQDLARLLLISYFIEVENGTFYDAPPCWKGPRSVHSRWIPESPARGASRLPVVTSRSHKRPDSRALTPGHSTPGDNHGRYGLGPFSAPAGLSPLSVTPGRFAALHKFASGESPRRAGSRTDEWIAIWYSFVT